jgi:hypothetical protein
MSALPDAGIDLSDVFAPLYWGFVISLVLGGITIVQAYIYFPAPQDGKIVRCTAVAMLVLDILSSALLAQSVYYYLIPHFGSLIPLGSLTPGLSVECLFSAAIMFISQLYFARQLYIVKGSGTRWWIAVLLLFAVVGFGGNIGCVTTMFLFPRNVLANRNHLFSIFAGIAKGFGAAADIVATTAMCIFLRSSRTGIPETNALLTKLTRFIIHRGALVTLFQTALIISFHAAPNHVYWTPIHLNVTKLYANTFFAMLNGRQHLKPNVPDEATPMSSTFEAVPPKRFSSRPSSGISSLRSERTLSSVSTV